MTHTCFRQTDQSYVHCFVNFVLFRERNWKNVKDTLKSVITTHTRDEELNGFILLHVSVDNDHWKVVKYSFEKEDIRLHIIC